MNRSLIMSIALVSLIAMGSPAMADRGDEHRHGNFAAGKGSHNGNHKPDSGMTDPNCRGVRASLFVIDHGGPWITGWKASWGGSDALHCHIFRLWRG